jgi:hypothetical protein
MEAVLRAGSSKYRLRRSGEKGDKWEPLPFVLASVQMALAGPSHSPQAKLKRAL